MAQLVVVTGPPGAGKSTVSALLAEQFDRSALVEGDAFFAFVKQGWIEPWVPESAEQNEVVLRSAAAAAGRLALGGYQTVYDGVLGPWFLPTFIEATGLASIEYVILLPTEDECVRRVATRVDHAFADEAATRKIETGMLFRTALVTAQLMPDGTVVLLRHRAGALIRRPSRRGRAFR